MHCDTYISDNNIEHENIAHTNIKERRYTTKVIVNGNPKGNVSDYVPFYFCPRSPMLYVINCGYVSNHVGDQSDIVHLCFNTEDILQQNSIWCYSDGNAAADYTAFFDDISFENVDFTIVNKDKWYNTSDDNDRKRKKQAEFLVHSEVSIQLLKHIGVHNQKIKQKVLSILANVGIDTDVSVEPKWYY